MKERILDKVKDKFEGDTYGGIPVFFILDPDGTVVSDSFGPGGNVGFPVSDEEIAVFGEIMKKAAVRITGDDIEQLMEFLIAIRESGID